MRRRLGETALTGPAQPEPDREAEVPAAQPSQGLVRQNAFLEEQEASDEVDSQVVICKKCHLEQDINTVVIRGPREMWCRACNNLYTLLRRNLAWPPAQFATMSEEQQAQFWAQCQKDREESMKSSFCYSRVKDTLTKVMAKEQVKQRRLEVGGTYLPLSVYAAKGYTIDADFESRNARQWSDGLQCWTYLHNEVSVSESDIHSTVERTIVEAERNVRKRKAAVMNGDEDKKSVAASSTDNVMDLVSESEGEGSPQSGF